MESSSTDVESFSEQFKSASNKAEFKFKCRLSENLKLDQPEERRSSFLLQQQQLLSKPEGFSLGGFNIYLPIITLILFLFLIFQFSYILQMRSDNALLRETLVSLSSQIKEASVPLQETIVEAVKNEL